jgi:hypothetical protein
MVNLTIDHSDDYGRGSSRGDFTKFNFLELFLGEYCLKHPSVHQSGYVSESSRDAV